MVKCPKLEEYKNKEENIIKDAGNLFRLKRLKKETNDATIEGVRDLFTLKKENKAIKGRKIKDIRILFEHEEDYYKPVRVYNFWKTIILNITVKVIEKH